MRKYFRNEEMTYVENELVKENVFIGASQINAVIPEYEGIKDKLPQPVWQDHESYIDCYYKAWELAWKHIHNPMTPEFVSPFIDSAFNDYIFMWDSCMILMFGKYGDRYFPFQKTLDNFYALQHKDGYISREISEIDASEKFTRHDPSGTGPNIMAWCEYEYYKFTGDKSRILKVFPVLLAFHQWFKEHRTWKDGSYFSSGLGCGLDNTPRGRGNDWEDLFSTNHMTWCDTCMQQLLNCKVLIKMAEICGRTDEISEIQSEYERLGKWVNENLWDEKTGYYYDLWADNQLNMVKSIGSYWALLADIIPKERLQKFISHLDNEKEFKRPNRVPSLSADDKNYNPGGGYSRGSVYAATNYMILKGLAEYDEYRLAYDIAATAVDVAVKTFEKTNTIWENYSPENAEQGNRSKPDMVGWSGLFPISLMIEFIFGITYNAEQNEITWRINLTEEFGVRNYPIGRDKTIDLICKARESKNAKPELEIKSDADVKIHIIWEGGSYTL